MDTSLQNSMESFGYTHIRAHLNNMCNKKEEVKCGRMKGNLLIVVNNYVPDIWSPVGASYFHIRTGSI